MNLISILAQSRPYTSSGFENSGLSNGLTAGLIIAYLVFLVLLYVGYAIVLQKIFKKAGRNDSWAAWVPIYNAWVLMEISGKPGWWALVGLGGVVPILGFIAAIASIVLSVLANITLSKRFGKGTGFAVLLILVPIVGLPILAFGEAIYDPNANPQGPNVGPPASSSPPTAPAI